MTTTTAIPGSKQVDLTRIGTQVFREGLRTALHEIEGAIPESGQFWSWFAAGEAPAQSASTLVLADLWHLVAHFRRGTTHDWTAAVRRTHPYFVVFVRTDRDRACAAMVDDLVRASDMRLNVCNDASDWALVTRCLGAGLSSVRPDGLVEVRYLVELDALWAQFGDGLTGVLTWEALQLTDIRDSLVPESATVSSAHTAIEIATTSGELFEIDSAVGRALLDSAYSARLQLAAEESDSALGTRVKTARVAAGLTQPALSERTGLDQAVISRIERGRVRPRIDTLRRLATGLHLTVSELLSD